MKNSNLISRRKALIGAIATGGVATLFHPPIRQFLNSLVNDIIQKSKSRYLKNDLSIQPARNFVQFNMYGAPPRWHFDHVLRPTDSDPFLECIGVYNKFSSVESSNFLNLKGTYSDVKVNGINMPHLWQYDVAKVNGSTRPMAELMKNMLMIRGCKLNTDGHPINCERQVSPISGDYSITGLVADQSKKFFPAINVGTVSANKAYKSMTGVGVTDIPIEAEDYISHLLDVFMQKNISMNNKNLHSEISLASAKLEQYSLSNQPGASILYNEKKRAEKVLHMATENFVDSYKFLTSKYAELYKRSASLTPILGVDDVPIPGIQLPIESDAQLDVNSALGIFAIGNTFNFCPDYRTLFQNIESIHLAKQFALAEFALTEGLCSSLLMIAQKHERDDLLQSTHATVDQYMPDQIEAIYNNESRKTILKVKDNAVPFKNNRLNFITDSHEVGWVPSLIGCNYFYRSFSSCLLELIDQLKQTKIEGNNLFNETVIQFATEFERYPTGNGTGSQHNISASVTSLFSGIVKKPTLLGNIFVGRDSKSTNSYPRGTIGVAAPVDNLPNKTININNISSTLSEMLRVPRIVDRSVPLVSVSGDMLTPTIENGKNIEDEKV